MNEITAQDEDYQSLLQRADECTDRLVALDPPKETRKLIDWYASECRELLFGSGHPGKGALPSELL